MRECVHVCVPFLLPVLVWPFPVSSKACPSSTQAWGGRPAALPVRAANQNILAKHNLAAFPLEEYNELPGVLAALVHRMIDLVVRHDHE